MNQKRNKRLMQIVRHVHGLMDIDDTQKNRDSQEHLGNLYSNAKNYIFDSETVNTIHGEWTKFINGSHDNTIIFYCHGGGYMTGSCLYARSITTKLSKYTLHDVFCFDYALAPEHPFPAAIDDALTAWNHIIEKGYKPENIIVAGDSAGGNLALALSLSLRSQKKALPKCLVLFSPWTDMTATSKSYQTKEMLDPVLNSEYIKKAAASYLQNTPVNHPLASPLFASFEGFPPVYIQVGSNEILLEDSVQLHKLLLSENVYAKLDIFEGMWHVFQMTPIKSAQNAILKVCSFLHDLP